MERFESLVLKAIDHENEEREIVGIALLRGSEVVTTPLSVSARVLSLISVCAYIHGCFRFKLVNLISIYLFIIMILYIICAFL